MTEDKMRVMVLEEFNQPLMLRQVPVPRLGKGEVLVRVLNCGVCGTDLKIFTGILPPSVIKLPHIMGHEVVGEVACLAPDVKDLKIGQRVIVYPYITCGECRFCRTGRENICVNIKRCGFEVNGGYAEFLKVPARDLCPFQDILPEKAAILPDAIATSYHAIKRQGRVRVSDRVLIVGCGGLGIHAVQIASLCGAEVAVADVAQKKLDRVKKLVSDVHLINPGKENPAEYIKSWTRGEGVDVVIETVGDPETLKWSLPSLRRGGRLVIVGYKPDKPFPLATVDMHLNEWEIVGVRLGTREELMEAMHLVNESKITPVVDRTFPLEEVNTALKVVQEGDLVGRVVLEVCS